MILLVRSASLPSPGACYRALRRLPGQDSHLLEERVFQDAPCRNYRGNPEMCLPREAQQVVQELMGQAAAAVFAQDYGTHKGVHGEGKQNNEHLSWLVPRVF